MIEAHELTKRFGTKIAVDHLSFSVRPGAVTGFLGPNGAGKSTTMRMVLGLDRPSGGTVTVDGRDYRTLAAPVREVGAVLAAGEVDGRRSARDHLAWVARAGGIAARRVDEVLDLVGLTVEAGRKVGEYSLGMKQRLGIATALIGDPPVLLFDEPINGLDPQGIRWIRTLMRGLAEEGRTVLVSSHLMSEMESTADRVIVIGRGRLIVETTMTELTQMGSGRYIRVVTPEPERLRGVLTGAGGTVTVDDDGAFRVGGLDNAAIGDLASHAHVTLHELTPRHASLETVFMELTDDSVEYRASGGDGSGPAIPAGDAAAEGGTR